MFGILFFLFFKGEKKSWSSLPSTSISAKNIHLSHWAKLWPPPYWMLQTLRTGHSMSSRLLFLVCTTRTTENLLNISRDMGWARRIRRKLKIFWYTFSCNTVNMAATNRDPFSPAKWRLISHPGVHLRNILDSQYYQHGKIKCRDVFELWLCNKQPENSGCLCFWLPDFRYLQPDLHEH